MWYSEIFFRGVRHLDSIPVSSWTNSTGISGKRQQYKECTNVDTIPVARPNISFSIDLYTIWDARIRICKHALVSKCLGIWIDVIGVAEGQNSGGMLK
jgi:hypothetical protein